MGVWINMMWPSCAIATKSATSKNGCDFNKFSPLPSIVVSRKVHKFRSVQVNREKKLCTHRWFYMKSYKNHWNNLKKKNSVSPANEFVFSKAEIETHLPWSNNMGLLASSFQMISTDSVEAPRSFARPHSQAWLLRVDCKHGELRLRQGTCNKINIIKPPKHSSITFLKHPCNLSYENCVPFTIILSIVINLCIRKKSSR